MPLITSTSALRKQVDTRRTNRLLRRHGVTLTAAEIFSIVDAGHTPERTALTSQLLAVNDDGTTEAVVMAAYSGYLAGLIANTRTLLDQIQSKDMWAIGWEVLAKAVKTSSLCDGGDFHIIRSLRRDFVRAMERLRSDQHDEQALIRVLETELLQPWLDDLSAVAIDELVEWVASQFDTKVDTARMVVMTRLGGFSLGPVDEPSTRSRNCRDRQRVEARMRGFVSPAEGLAENVLARAA